MKKISEKCYRTDLVYGRELKIPPAFYKKIDGDGFYRKIFVLRYDTHVFPHVRIAPADDFELIRSRKTVKLSDCYETEFFTAKNGQKRVFITDEFRESCGIEKEVIIMDIGKSFNIWNPEVYERLIKEGKANHTGNSARVASFRNIWGKKFLDGRVQIACYTAMANLAE
jgi:hypothetical protein